MRNYKNYNENNLKEDMKNINWNEIIFKQSFNESWDAFKTKLIETINNHAPLTEKARGKSCPWLNNQIKAKMKERDYHLKKSKKTE